MRRGSLRLDIVIPLLLAVIASGFMHHVLVPRALVAYDEAYYLAMAKEMMFALKTADWTMVGTLFSTQFEKTSLPTFLFGLMLIPTGFSVVIARSVNLLWYILSVLLASAIAKKAVPEKFRSAVSGITALLYTVSPMMLFMGSLFMRETFGVFLTLLVVWGYLCSGRSVLKRVLVSIGLACLASVKYNYGLLVLGILGVEECIAAVSVLKTGGVGKLPRLILGLIALVMPFVLLLAAWLLIPADRTAQFFAVLRNEYYVTSSLETQSDIWLFYPRAILYMYTPSVIVGILMLASVPLSLKWLKKPAVRMCLGLFLLNVVLGIRNAQNLQERFVFTAVPGLFVVAAVVWTDVGAMIYSLMEKQGWKPRPWLLWTALVACILMVLVNLPTRTLAVGSYAFKSPVFNQPDYRDLWFDYDMKKWAWTFPPDGVPSISTLAADIIETVNVEKPVTWIGESNEFSEFYRALVFDPRLVSSRPTQSYASYAVVFKTDPSSRYYTRDYRMTHLWKEQGAAAIESDPSWILLAEKKYGYLGITTQIYGRNR